VSEAGANLHTKPPAGGLPLTLTLSPKGRGKMLARLRKFF